MLHIAGGVVLGGLALWVLSVIAEIVWKWWEIL